jgi:hypothetical protein
VQADAVIRKTHEVGHGRPLEAAAGWDFVNPHLRVSSYQLAVLIVDLAVEVGLLILDLLHDGELSGRRRVLVNTRCHGGPANLLVSTVKAGLLLVDANLYVRDVLV